ncbi:hypothetical protein TNCT6_10750 [Streptomyces sp. 6-11-2]|nr:hypothetical protein TNCT6_10750 [Streptomyces sp. 6-11-2]
MRGVSGGEEPGEVADEGSANGAARHPRTRAPAHPRTRAPAHPRTRAPAHPRTRAPAHQRIPPTGAPPLETSGPGASGGTPPKMWANRP